ncbi:outer membrane beta-barrel protein [Subsaximicrobium wynnwilliamsii]|uniref:Outer membrane beta-barrel protein n=1 Tax=Subsaximicrobium wynnwilliamsii TaxID=291179 RepID=A0A5C6ZP70_9FLAO|nr:carboxypeptidase-like regulatory domain-containing protein [Subsaximicrobium wynnwilliamsii]TXD85463.1 outer membrane beta-barrel protein [Subsaximicrobium wynnwilliamsii]TXD90816.1 outer membrane beta-barrel protein [Subsaximicrobium wynnwilliamsii]TXE05323.1 outer membrane beta-barrel protein [Subsaximicrobium wynnwilliamsii]
MKQIAFLTFLLTTTLCTAQIIVKGVVKDSIGQPLELANIIAINTATKAMASYAITNDKGEFKLDLEKNTAYTVQVSYIGMKTFSETLSTIDTNIDKNYTLKEDNVLDEVELTYEMPVTIRGDTLVYNADSFKDGTERKLEDVLKKLPGVEINADGQIEVEGKVVTKLMVDGKDFFDGDTKLATKNIPSNAVDKVQVLKNYSEVGQLGGVTNNQDNIAINIKLKEGKKNFWFGDVTAGSGVAGTDDLYLLQPKLFYYSPKYSINLIGDLNNIGEVALTNRDIRNFGGGFRAPSQSSGTSINLGDNGLSGLTNIANAQKVVTKLAAANFSYAPKKSLDLSGFLIYNSSRLRTRQESFVQYTNSELGIPDEATVEMGREASNQGLAKLSASYKPNPNNQIDYDVLGRISDGTEAQNLFSSVVGNTNQLDKVKPFSINQNLNYYYTLNENNIFALEAQHLFKDEDPFYNAVLANDPTNNEDGPNADAFDNTAEGLGLDRNQFNYDLNQERRIKSNQLDAKLDYYHILNNVSNINFTLGTILSKQQFNSKIFQFLDDGSFFDPTPVINEGLDTNDTEYNFSDIYLGAHYRLKTGKFTITPGFSVHAYGNKNIQFGETFEDNFVRILPDFETRIQFKKSENLIFRYNMRNSFTDVTSLAQGLVLNNFNSIQFGNPELQNALSHNLNLSYFSFNMFNYTNIYAVINYNKNVDEIRNLTNFDNVIRTSTFFNSNFADESLTAFGRVQRTFGKLRASLRTSFNYSKNNQFIQGIQSVNERFVQSYTPELRTNFREAPNVSVSYNYSVSNNNQGSNATTFTTNSPTLEFDAYIWKSVTFKTDYAYTNQDNGTGQSQSFQNWNASLSYRKDRDAKLEYQVRATNLLDVDSQVSNGANAISVFSSETFIQPRFVTFRLIYTL